MSFNTRKISTCNKDDYSEYDYSEELDSILRIGLMKNIPLAPVITRIGIKTISNNYKVVIWKEQKDSSIFYYGLIIKK